MKILHTQEPIKNCPCCGSTAQAYQSDSRVVGHNEHDDSVGIKCQACFLKVEKSYYADALVAERLEDVLLLWNARVSAQ